MSYIVWISNGKCKMAAILVWFPMVGLPDPFQNPNHLQTNLFSTLKIQKRLDFRYSLCYETIMFGRVTHARCRCKARALFVYLTHILS